jgi:hypothetical protein
MFWNAENDCWTTAESAATEYEECDDCPEELPNGNSGLCGTLGRSDNHEYYHESDTWPTAIID